MRLFRTRNLAIAAFLALIVMLMLSRERLAPPKPVRPDLLVPPKHLPMPSPRPRPATREEQEIVHPRPPIATPAPTSTPTPTSELAPPRINLYQLSYPGRTAVLALPSMPDVLDLYEPPVTELVTLPTASRFDFPLGTSNGGMAYNAQPFGKNAHLGDDWNGLGGYNTDLGAPVRAAATGRVVMAAWLGGDWGNVVIVQHAYLENGERQYVQTLYAHLQKMTTRTGKIVRRGQQIGAVGNAEGRFYAHLHFEMRSTSTLYIGGGYRVRRSGWINPSQFIQEHRGAAIDDFTEDFSGLKGSTSN